MAENEIPLEFTAETKTAQKQIENFIKALEKAAGTIDKDFKKVDDNLKKSTAATSKALKQISGFADGIKAAFGVAIAFLAGRELANAFSRAIHAASEADQAVAKLNLALASTGEFSAEASLELQEYARQIEETTTLSDEAVLAGLALAKTFGITNKEAQGLVDAAVDLAAATGQDLDSAINTLGKSLAGSGKELKKLGPEFANLTEQQLKSGVAIDLVSKRFDGFAQGLTKTFGGAVLQLGNNFDNLFESIGKIVTQNPVVIATINTLSKTFAELSKFLDQNKISFSEELSVAIKLFLNLTLNMIKGVTALTLAFEQLTNPVVTTGNFFLSLKDKILGTTTVQDKLKEQVDKINSGYVSTGRSLADFTEKLEKQIKEIDKIDNAAKPATKAVNNFNKALGESGKDDLEKVKGSFDKIKSAIQPIEDEINKQTKSVEELAKVETDRAKELVKNAEKELKATGKLTDENKKLLAQYLALIEEKAKLAKTSIGKVDVSEFFSGGLGGGANKFFDEFVKSGTKAFSNFEIKDTGKFARSLSLAVASSVANGVISAVDTFANIMKGVISGEFLKAGLDFAKEIASFPETMLSILRDFDGIFTDLANNLPDVISALITKLPEVFNNLASNIGNIINTLVERMPEIIGTLIEGLNKFIDVFVDTAPKFAEAIANGVGDIIDAIAARLPEILQSAGAALEKIVSVLFKRVIPAIIKALPTIVKEALKTLGNVIEIILQSLPEIITELLKAIPQIVKAIADAIPRFVEIFSENADEIILALVEGLIPLIPDIVIALVDSFLVEGGLERIIVASIKAIPRVSLALVQGMLRGTATLFQNMGASIGRGFTAAFNNLGQFRFKSIDELKEIISSFPSKITESISRLQGSFSNVFSSLGLKIQESFGLAGTTLQEKIKIALTGNFEAIFERFKEVFSGIAESFSEKIKVAFSGIGERIKNALLSPINTLINFLRNFKFPDIGGSVSKGAKGLKEKIGFAEGGLVPKGFPDDSFPARLTSGELIIPKDLVSSLGAFLDGQTASKTEDSGLNAALLARIANLLEQPIQVQTTAELNGRALANIILDLSRNNARLSA